MKISILQNDQIDFKKSKIQIETDFACLGDMSAAVLFMVCDGNPKQVSLANLIVSCGTAQQREEFFFQTRSFRKRVFFFG